MATVEPTFGHSAVEQPDIAAYGRQVVETEAAALGALAATLDGGFEKAVRSTGRPISAVEVVSVAPYMSRRSPSAASWSIVSGAHTASIGTSMP